jgi:hypothetical protein
VPGFHADADGHGHQGLVQLRGRRLAIALTVPAAWPSFLRQASSHHYGKIIAKVSLSELQRNKASPRPVYGRQQACAKLDASKEQGVELGHDIFCLS